MHSVAACDAGGHLPVLPSGGCSLPQSAAGPRVDSKLRRKIQGKKIAVGHKPDDHEKEETRTQASEDA